MLEEEYRAHMFAFCNPPEIFFTDKRPLTKKKRILVEGFELLAESAILLLPFNFSAIICYDGEGARASQQLGPFLTFQLLKGPVQPNNKDCGCYIMRVMRDLVRDESTEQFIEILCLAEEVLYYSQR